MEDASRDLTSAARAALEGDGGVGIKNARFKMLVRLVPRSAQKTLDLNANNIGDAGAQALAPELPHTCITTLSLGYARARARESRVSRRRSDARFSPSSSRAA